MLITHGVGQLLTPQPPTLRRAAIRVELIIDPWSSVVGVCGSIESYSFGNRVCTGAEQPKHGWRR